jgi:serine/threonine protein kinase/tetratricopeptide (TPR) repeat protein
VDPLLWKRIGELFAAARLLDGESRIAFLKQNCGQDQELFEQVIALLDIDSKPGPLDSAPTASALPVPQVIAGRFRIIRYIAEGGMGTVYEAEDLTLSDRVALKTIRPDIAAQPRAVERFKHEIVLGKKVTHPNVCRIHDLGVDRSENGTEFLFLTMQFLSGETLASRIVRGPISKTEALPLIEDMADALSAAHQAEVIHRDFKSGNVMLVSGANRTCAVVTDFGLARGIHDDSSRTHAGMIGTVEYMAPEQIRGEELTPAADIYALGVVMYEMVTGQRPFIGDSKVTVALKHLNDEPQPPRDFVPHLDPNWEETILCCLRKPPHERFQSAADVKAALAHNGAKSRRRLPSSRPKPLLLITIAVLTIAIAAVFWLYRGLVALPSQRHVAVLGVPSSRPIKSIAVLPLANFSADPEQAYFADGMTEELINALSRISALRVISRTSAMKYKGTDKPLAKIVGELNVDALVEGTVQLSGDRVKISADLVDAREDRTLWGHSYEGNLRDILSLQSEVAQAIANEIKVQLSPEESAILSRRQAVNPQAYETYLHALYLWNKRTPEDLRRALDEFKKAIDQDPTSALAWAGLADCYTLLVSMGEVAPRDAMPLAEAAAKRALQLDNSLAQAHASLAMTEWTYEWDRAGAGDEFARAIALNPSYAIAREWHGLYLNYVGRFQEALQEMQRAEDLDPLSTVIQVNVGRCYYYARHYDTASDLLKRVEEKEPESWIVTAVLGQTYLAKGRLDDAIRELDRARTLSPSALRNLGVLGDAYGRKGQRSSALQIASDLDGLSRTRYVPPIYKALIYMGIADKTRAFAFLDKAFAERSGWMMELNVEPEFDRLRGDARFQALLRRVAEAGPNPPK